MSAPAFTTSAAQRPRAPVDRVDERAFVVRLHVLEVVTVLRRGLAGAARPSRRASSCRTRRARVGRTGSGSAPTATGSSPLVHAAPSHADRPRRPRAARPAAGRRPCPSPSGPASTNVSPPDDFLSRAITASSVVARRRRRARAIASPSDATTARWRSTSRRGNAFERAGELRGEHEPDRDRLAVRERVAAHRLERVRERVAVVEVRAQRRDAPLRRLRRSAP